MSWTVRNKLLSSFVVMITILAALGALTLVHMGRLNEVAERLATFNMRAVYLLGRIDTDTSELRLNSLSHIRAKGEQEMTRYEMEAKELDDKIRNEMKEYESVISSDEERRLYMAFARAHDRRISEAKRVRLLSRSNEDEQAEGLYFGANQEAYDSATEALRSLVSYQQAEGTRARGLAAETYASARWQFVAIMLLAFVAKLASALWLSSNMATPVSRLSQVFGKISNGDSTGAADELRSLHNGEERRATRSDEIGALITAARDMVEARLSVSRSLRQGVTKLSSSAAQISTTAKEYAATASEQASSVAEVSTTIEEIKQTSQAAAEAARQVAESSDDASQTGQIGRERITEAVATMQTISERVAGIASQILQLSEQTSQIGSIIDTVNDLAEQSNLLAVNASIEVAKAGEHGRGFAVVASEVRSLAEQSKRATQQIRGILGDIQKATQSAVMATEEGTKRSDDGRRAIQGVRSVVEGLAAALEETSGRARQIAGSSAQQASGIAQIAAAMENVSKASQDNARGVRQLEAAVLELEKLATELKSTSERF